MDAYQAGFDKRVPADWEPVSAVWLAWPHNRETWPGYQEGRLRFDGMEPFYRSTIQRLSAVTPVYLLAEAAVALRATATLKGIANVTIVEVPTDDVWVRDYGLTFVKSRATGAMFGIDWQYNAWGGKYGPFDRDDAAAKSMGAFLGLPVIRSRLCLEGGALEFDGDRRLITSPGCLVTETRNPGWTEERIGEEIFLRTGATEIAWIDGGGLEGDDTDGHIDQIARFVDPKNVVVAVAEEGDTNHERLNANWNQLSLWSTSTHPQVTLHQLPIPPARFIDGKRVPESYCNFLRVGPNDLFLPTFDASTDDHAIGLIKDLTGATIHPIDCREIAWGLGALHCATREVPRVDSSDASSGIRANTGA